MSTTLIELSVPWKELKKSNEKQGSSLFLKLLMQDFFQVREFCIPKRNIKVSVDLFENEYQALPSIERLKLDVIFIKSLVIFALFHFIRLIVISLRREF